MKLLNLLKKIISLFILVVAIGLIIWFTSYTLNNKGIRDEVYVKSKKTIEKVSSNIKEANISYIYNIYLSKEKHKVKIEYQLVEKADVNNYGVALYIYVDGKSTLEREIMISNEIINLEELVQRDDISKYIVVNEQDFNIIKDGNKEYLVVSIGSLIDSIQEYFYVINGNGELINNEGILVYNLSKRYMISDEEEFTNYYGNDISLAKINNNYIYALEEKVNKDKISLEEYKYYLTMGELKKELVNVYEGLKIKVIDEEQE